MLDSIKQRLDRDDEGFTLIELMVVVLIIAILLAIAIPTFLSARDTANARAAQSNLRNALTAEQEYYTNNQAFGAYSVMSATENNLSWVSADVSTNPSNAIDVSFLGSSSNTDDTVILGAHGADGKCYEIAQVNETGTVPAGTYYQVFKPAAGTSCAFSSALPSTETVGSAATGDVTAGATNAAPADGAWFTGW